MNWEQIEGNPKQRRRKGRARQRWGKLTDDQLDQTRGGRKELAGKVQETYGKRRERAQREVEESSRGL